MANLLEIKRRIRSVKNTQQITRAMKMVAAAKLRRAQERVISARPYAQAMKDILGSLTTRVNRSAHPLLAERGEVVKELVVVIAGDRGLCGAFNANVFKMAEHAASEASHDMEFFLVGKKSVDYFKHHPQPTLSSMDGIFNTLDHQHAEALAEKITAPFLKGEVQAVSVVYNEFKSLMRQEVVREDLLPIAPETFGEPDAVEYLYEPDPDTIFHELLPRHITYQLWRMLLESTAAEQAARMTAMEGATRNADEMIDSLTMIYNRTRQAAITRELIEIVSGAEAL